MKYTEILDMFWGMDRNISHYEIILFHYLLYRCSSLGWPDTFSVSNEELMQTLKLRPTYMREARKGLVDAGLITFQSGTGRGGTSYYSLSPDTTEKGVQTGTPFAGKGVQTGTPFAEKGVQTGTPFEEKRGTNGNTFSNASDSKSSKENPEATPKGSKFEPFSAQPKTEEKKTNKENNPPAPPIKKKNKEKKKELTQSNTLLLHSVPARMHTHEDESTGQIEIVFNELKEKPLKKKREATEPILPQDINEVISFFETQGRMLQDWRAEAEAFFYHFEAVGWMGTSNRKIQDWKSRAHLWISDKIVKEKQQSQRSYGTTTNQQNNDRAARAIEAAELVERLLREDEEEQGGVPH